ATTLHYGGNFTDIHHPTAEQLFGQASLVMQPKAPTEPGLLLSIPRIYGPYLASHFHMVGESQGWRLYRRDGEAAPGHAAGQASGPAAAHAAGHAAGHGTGHAG